MQDEVCIALRIPTGRTAGTVNISIFACRHVIVDDMMHLRDIQSASCKVGTDENITTAIAELIESPLSGLLLHASMIDFVGKLLFTEITTYPVDRFTMVAEHDRLPSIKRTQQFVESMHLSFQGRCLCRRWR